MAPSNWLKGTVKSILSGDTLIIMGVSRGGAPPEKQITLSSIKAPRLGRRDGASQDEPFAWQSREFLRKKAIGQSCVFRVDYSVEALNNREFGTVFVGTENLAMLMIEKGLAKVSRQGSQRSENFEELEIAEKTAEANELGVWTKDEAAKQSSIRELAGDSGPTAAQMFEEIGKGNEAEGIVEQVINGSTLRVTLLPSFHSVVVSVAGVQAPSMGRKGGASETREDACAAPSKHFTECRVLNRDITLLLQGLDRYDSLFAKVLFQMGPDQLDLGKELLKYGFAKTVEWSLAMMTDGVAELHSLERTAKEAKKNIWKDYVAQPSNSDKLTERFSGTVMEVTSGDCIVVLDSHAHVERRVQLSSVRAPKVGRGNQQSEDWGFEAKEFLRMLLIGKNVMVQLEYNKKIQDRDLVLMFANVTFKSARNEEVNAGEVVIENGFASVQKHRTDEERSCIYERLLAAEEKAKAGKVGIHSGKAPPAHRVNDLSGPGNAKKAKDFLSFLTRKGKLRGVVDFVMSGHRLKIYIPSEGVLIALALAGVKSPARAQPARDGKKELEGEPYAEEALSFTKKHLMQREVLVQVETCDKRGTFMGSLLLPGQVPFDLGLALLERGLAQLHFTFDESRPGGNAYVTAENMAREAKRGIWENYVPPAEPAEDENGTQGKGRASGPVKVAVTHIEDATKLYVQKTDESQMQSITEQLSALSLSDQPPSASPPQKGTFCFGKFTLDDEWYRGYVTEVKDGKANVYFMDFGNSELLPPDRCLPIDPSLASIPPQAHTCKLAYIKVPALGDNLGYEAAKMVDTIVGEGRECNALVVGRDRQTAWNTQSKDPRTANPILNVILTPVGESKSVNAMLLEEGLAKLPNLDTVRGNAAFKEGVRSLQQFQDIARKHHRGLFIHGDPGDSDEEDLPPLGSQK